MNIRSLSRALLLIVNSVHAQIETDGSLGPAQALNGLDYIIDENLGKRAGDNLYHSFKEFNVHEGESATFTGASEIANVISRVTGGKLSKIDGLLKSEIPNANLYLINPAGILFGPNASLSINGSFHTSNADFIRLGDVDLFYSEPLQGEILSVAAPKAFGFFGAPKGNIFVDGSQFDLPEKATLSLVGGEIIIEDEASIRIPQGQINLIGVNSAGEVSWGAPVGYQDPDASAFTALNKIHISSGSELNVDGEGGGRIVIRGGQLTLKDAVISATTGEGQSGRGVDIKSERFDFVRSQVDTTTTGTGSAGEIQIDANILVLNGLGESERVGIFANSTDLISSNIGQNTIGSGKAGTITITANQVDIRGDVAIETTAIASENIGVIDLSTTELTLDGFGAKFQVNSGKGEFTRFTDGNIVLDGSLYPDRDGEVLAGPDYEITADMGRAVENNLFHSFRSFFVNEGETATFSGPDTISNIITRVTGENATNIYGGLNLNIPEANLYFINPNGLFFGPNASLSLPGSFHIGTADYLAFQDGGRFDVSVPDESILDGSELNAYGFRDDKVGEITVEGRLELNEGETFSLIGGDLQLQDDSSRVIASSGQINLVSLQSAGEVFIVNGSEDLDVSEFMELGNIAIVDNAAANVTNSDSDSSAGRLFVRSNDLRLDNGGELRARNVGQGVGGSMDLLISGDLFIGKASGIEMGGNGILGQLSVEAENITINGAGQERFSGIEILQFGEIDGSENNLRIEAKQELKMLNGGVINTSTTGAGNAGSTIIQANALTIDGQGAAYAGIGSVSDYNATGDGGDLDIQIAEQIEISNGGTINISTFSEAGGSSGKARIRAKNLTINGSDSNGPQTGIIALASSNTKGNSGSVDIDIDEKLQVLKGGLINTSTFGTGNAGSITIQAKDLTLDGQNSNFAGIGSIAGPDTTGNGGDLHILVTEQMKIVDSGIIDASTFGTGDAGSITVQAKNLTLDGKESNFAVIRSVANSGFNSNGGNIEITIAEQFEIINGGEISAFAATGNAGSLSISAGGDILIENSRLSISAGQGNFNVNDLDDFQQPELFIEAGDSIYIKDSILSTDAGVLGSERGAGGDIYLQAPIEVWLENSTLLAQAGYIGGNVFIDPIRYIVLSSDVIAQADVQGGNYNVTVTAPSGWIQSADSVINLSGKQSGAVLSTTAPFDLGAELSDLNLDFLNVENWASQPCKLRPGGAGSSFVVVNWRGVSNNIDDFLPSEPILLTTDHNIFTTDPATDEFLQKAIFPELNDECEDCP